MNDPYVNFKRKTITPKMKMRRTPEAATRIVEMKTMLKSGATLKEVADKYNLTVSRVGQLTNHSYSQHAIRHRNAVKALRLYRWLEEFENTHKYKATHREMMEAGFGGSTSVTAFYLSKLESFGMIELHPGLSRAYRLIPLSQADPIIKEIIKQEKGGEL
jgi:hypothetical protein